MRLGAGTCFFLREILRSDFYCCFQNSDSSTVWNIFSRRLLLGLHIRMRNKKCSRLKVNHRHFNVYSEVINILEVYLCETKKPMTDSFRIFFELATFVCCLKVLTTESWSVTFHGFIEDPLSKHCLNYLCHSAVLLSDFGNLSHSHWNLQTSFLSQIIFIRFQTFPIFYAWIGFSSTSCLDFLTSFSVYHFVLYISHHQKGQIFYYTTHNKLGIMLMTWAPIYLTE